jgi:hypothetical protein
MSSSNFNAADGFNFDSVNSNNDFALNNQMRTPILEFSRGNLVYKPITTVSQTPIVKGENKSYSLFPF